MICLLLACDRSLTLFVDHSTLDRIVDYLLGKTAKRFLRVRRLVDTQALGTTVLLHSSATLGVDVRIGAICLGLVALTSPFKLG